MSAEGFKLDRWSDYPHRAGQRVARLVGAGRR